MPYITPESEPTASRCRRLSVPTDTRMIAALYGQIFELAEAHNWEQTDGITAERAAAIWEQIFYDFSGGSYCMIGAVVPILNDSVPDSMLICDGSTFFENEYPELYAVLPAFLQIDPDTGQLPDLRDSFILAAGSTHDDHDSGGAETVQLAESEMPSHGHLYDKQLVSVLPDAGGVPIPSALPTSIPTLTSFAGSDGYHDNMPPYYVLKYAVIAK